MIDLIRAEDLAHRLGYASANQSFREWCVQMRITPVPGRRGFYDPLLVRRRLDEAQGLITTAGVEIPGPKPVSLTGYQRVAGMV